MATLDRNGPDPGGAAPEEDPKFILKCLTELQTSQAEFPIRVEGAQTLPYSSQVLAIEGTTALILKLIRPLPHELMTGALFELVFSAGEQRYLGLITYLKREAYLTYRFSVPATLTLSDRRKAKRYPFRPRESVDVLAQDGSVPGYGMTGPLVNLSMGGMAFRVDRIVKLDDGLRIPTTKAFFDRGKVLSRIKIRNLPKVPLLDARGSVSHVEEVSDGVLLGVEFHDLAGEDASRLRMVLEIRERAFRSPVAPSAAEPRAPRSRTAKGDTPADPPAPAEPAQGLEEQPVQVLASLQRRCRNLYLVGGDSPETALVLARLNGAGYFRTWTFHSPAELGRTPFPGPETAGALVLVLDPARESLQEIRSAQQALGAWRELPAVYLSDEPNPVAGLVEEASWRLLPLPTDEDSRLIETLDQLLGTV